VPRVLSRPASLLLGLLLPATLLAVYGISLWMPVRAWPHLSTFDAADLPAVVIAYSLLPRIATALLAGAALGLAGGLAQVALRNPLAAPGTLGVSAGAALALSIVTLYAPALLAILGREVVAFAGGAVGIGLVMLLTVRSRLDPATVALAGLAVGLYAGSVAGVLAVLHTRQLAGLFVWSAGTLTQLGWDGSRSLLLTFVVGGSATALLARPLAMLDLPDTTARGLGVPVGLVRGAALTLSVGLTAAVVGQVGVIGFVGLAAPALARLGGRGRGMLLWSPLLGAGLLLLTDQVVQLLSGRDGALLPTGAFSALLGVPLLLWLLPRVAANTARPAEIAPGRLSVHAAPALLALVGLLLGVTIVALSIGQTANGWAWSTELLGQRVPRVAAAGIAGVVLAAAGTVLQRVLGNPMASPEVLGLGTGAIAGSGVALWMGLTGSLVRFGFGAAGAGGMLLLLLRFGRGDATRIVLAGIAVSAGAEAITALLLASGDPRAEIVLLWLSGSTYGMQATAIWWSCVLLALGLGACLGALRWLDILPLGPAVATALGISMTLARRSMLWLAALLTALGALLAGPLSFVGLVAPHVAQLVGLKRAGVQLLGAGLAGASIMITADWLGRTVLFPSEVPAGLLAALLGGPVLLLALTRIRP